MPGGGDVEYFENYSFLVSVDGVGNPRAFPLPILGREAGGGTGIWGVGWERGARLHLRCCSACGDSGNLHRTAQSSGKVAGFLAVAVFVFWALRDSVLAPNGCSPSFPKFYFSHGASFVKTGK